MEYQYNRLSLVNAVSLLGSTELGFRTVQRLGLNYKKISVDWTNFIRDLFMLFKQWVSDHHGNVQLLGDMEIDGSLFIFLADTVNINVANHMQV